MRTYINTKKNYVWITFDDKEPVRINGTDSVSVLTVLLKFFTGPTRSRPKKREEVIDYSQFKRSA